ncbi:uncharacterized protein [Centruroides vittatus]|uniref:uncharacterized protein n=1 Tax=Centruroides vittatus TaxID=120091 RepID=UPI00350EFD69
MLLLVLIAIAKNGCFVTSNEITHPFDQGMQITAEPGYRSVKLNWKFEDEDRPLHFLIKYCELVWSIKYRCRKRYLSTKDNPPTDNGIYHATIYDLRMSTNYTFMIEPQIYEEQLTENVLNKFRQRAKVFEVPSITVTTNGFAAEISRCVEEWSEIAVRTGPHFGGKITVENSNDERCSVYGNRSSSKDIYSLRIHHEICGSHRINNSEIQTTVVVFENKDVVTHNTRRYLVQCNLLPKIFSLQASIHVPNNKKVTETKHVRYPVMEDLDGTEDALSSTSNNVQDSRMDAEQNHFVHRTLHDDVPVIQEDQFLIITVIGCATVVISVGTVLCVMFGPKKKAKNMSMDNTFIKRDNIMQDRNCPTTSDKRISPESSIALTSMRCLNEVS